MEIHMSKLAEVTPTPNQTIDEQMQEIILCKGLPGSGKSTWAKQYCLEHLEYVRISKDDIREFLGNPKFSKDFESSVLDIEHMMGITILNCKKSLIIDSTNFSKKHTKYWKQISIERHILFTVKYFDTSLEECIERDSAREKSVGLAVILKMYETYVKGHNL